MIMQRWTRWLVCAVVCVGTEALLVRSATAQVSGTMKDALAVIPDNAMGFVCVPNVKAFDSKLEQTLKHLGLDGAVPPPMNSLAGILGVQMGMTEGLDSDGAVIVVMMPAAHVMELQMKTALIVATKDAEVLLGAMGGEAGEGGTWTVTMGAMPISAVVRGEHVVLAMTPDLAKNIATSPPIAKKLKPAELKTLEGLDLAVWVDGDRMLGMVKPQVSGFLDMAMMVQGGAASGWQAKQMEASKKQIDMFFDGTASMTLGLSLGQPGVGLRFGMTTKAGSALAKQIKLRPTTASLLTGVPSEKYMFAFGETVDPAAIKGGMEYLDMYLAVPDDAKEIDQDQLTRLKGVIEEWLVMITALRGSVVSLVPGPGGIFGLGVLIDTTDSAQWLELAGDVIDAGKKLATDADIKEKLEAIVYRTEAETISGVPIQHLKLDVDKIEAVDEDDMEEVLKIVGRDGMLLRMGAVDAKTVAVAFGGGAAHMGRLIETARKKDAPLDRDAGIKKVAAHMPGRRASVGYAAVDQILETVRTGVKLIDEDEEFPVRMPVINAPLAMTSSGGDGWGQFDLFVPRELLVAGAQAVRMMMGGSSQPEY